MPEPTDADRELASDLLRQMIVNEGMVCLPIGSPLVGRICCVRLIAAALSAAREEGRREEREKAVPLVAALAWANVRVSEITDWDECRMCSGIFRHKPDCALGLYLGPDDPSALAEPRP